METPGRTTVVHEPSLPASTPAAPVVDHTSAQPSTHASGHKHSSPLRWLAAVAVLAAAALGVRWFLHSLGHVSTDDAYVNGHVTFVAARVSGQIARVYVDDNNRVRRGDLLVQLDKEPYQVQVNIAQAAVDAAHAQLIVAQAEARSVTAQMRSLRFALQHSIEEVDNQVALLRSKVATLASRRATLSKAQAEYERAAPLVETRAVSMEDLDRRKESMLVASAQAEEALQGVYQVRASLGLPAQPASGDDLAQVPPDLNQQFSTVRQAENNLIQAAARVGVFDSFDKSPRQLVADFYKRDPSGDIDTIYQQILKDAPDVKQAEARLAQAQRNLDQARLDLRYCDVIAEIDGVITRREANPGNNVLAGQALMTIRSLDEIWVDANFKETQLRELRIGQPVDLSIDMYGGHHHFRGRITGFTMGTGSTLSLLPPENATGNFVKVVQRLPVRIDLIDYDPERAPLFVGLSVRPVVDVRASPTGPSAGKVLQPYAPAPSPPTSPPPSGNPAPVPAEPRP